jgi:hypothetical protein
MNAMTKYIVEYEDQSIEVEEEIARDDETLIRALSPWVDNIATARIERQEEKDGVMKIKIIKRAGTKGNAVLHGLIRAKESRNPVIALYLEVCDLDLNALTPLEQYTISDRLNRVLQDGREQEEAIERVLTALRRARPAPASRTVFGF